MGTDEIETDSTYQRIESDGDQKGDIEGAGGMGEYQSFNKV